MTSVAGLLTWAGIVYTYIRFHKGLKAQGIDRSTLPYRAPLQPYLSYYAFVFILVILFFNGWEVFAHYGAEGYSFDHATCEFVQLTLNANVSDR